MINITLDQIQALSGIVLAIFTAVLAFVTWLYYCQSREQTGEISSQTNEMINTRELRYEPYLKAGLKPTGPNFELGFVNIGGGIAHDVHAKYWVEGLEQFQREWGTSVHFPDDIYRIGFPIDDSEIGVIGMTEQIESELVGDSDTLIVEWTYKDSRNEEFQETQKMSILDEIQIRSESTEFYSGEGREVKF